MSISRRMILLAIGPLFAAAAFAAEGLVDRWASAVGGREKVALIRTIYREATIQVGSYEGWIKVWHTADGTYRKEEQVGPFASVETFDGATSTVKQGAMPSRKNTGADLARARSSAVGARQNP